MQIRLLAISIMILHSTLGLASATGQEDDYRELVGRRIVWKVIPAAVAPSETVSLATSQVESRPGNAAPYYYRAFLLYRRVPEEDRQFAREAASRSIGALDRDRLEAGLRPFRDALSEFRIATSREHCDWGLRPLDVENGGAFYFHPMEIQYARYFSRLMLLSARLKILDGKFNEALQEFRNGFQLARHLQQIELVVAAIRASDVHSQMMFGLQELSQVNNAPNLYTAMASLPANPVDAKDHVRKEMEYYINSFAFLDNPSPTDKTIAQWRSEYLDAMRAFDQSAAPDKLQELDATREERLAVLMSHLYPIAKHELRLGGWDGVDLEAMPVGQVVAIQTRRVLNQYLERRIADLSLPDHLIKNSMSETTAYFDSMELTQLGRRGEFPIMAFFEKGYISALISRRINRNMAIHKNVEIIRAFAQRNGRMPESLSELSRPALPDPFTAEAFSYEKTDAGARLQTVPQVNHERRFRFTEISVELNFNPETLSNDK